VDTAASGFSGLEIAIARAPVLSVLAVDTARELEVEDTVPSAVTTLEADDVVVLVLVEGFKSADRILRTRGAHDDDLGLLVRDDLLEVVDPVLDVRVLVSAGARLRVPATLPDHVGDVDRSGDLPIVVRELGAHVEENVTTVRDEGLQFENVNVF